jgi:hypothetical protein
VYVQEHLALLHVLAARLREAAPSSSGSWWTGRGRSRTARGGVATTTSSRSRAKSYGWQVRLTRALQRWWWGRCSRIICCSEFLRRILVDHHGVAPEKAVTILNAYHGPSGGRRARVP